MQDYIDAQYGGPGKGWYRIVNDPFQARQVINAGQAGRGHGHRDQRAVRLHDQGGRPDRRCTAEEIDRQLDEVHKLGVRQMELVNKFDNALSGVAGDEGETGVVVNGANFLETGSFWDMRHCEPRRRREPRQGRRSPLPDIGAGQQDALFGAIGQLFGGLAAPCSRSTADAATATSAASPTSASTSIRGLAKRKMIFDPDHMSVKARQAALDLIEKLDYPGVISSHSWSTPDAYPRIYERGGVHHAVRRRLDGLRREVAAAPRLGRQALLLRLRLRRRHQRPRRAGRPARRRRRTTR